MAVAAFADVKTVFDYLLLSLRMLSYVLRAYAVRVKTQLFT